MRGQEGVAKFPLDGQRALVISPGNVSYFYDSEGRRIAEVLRNLGCTVDIGTLRDYPRQPYDWCFFLNLSEIVYGYGDERAVMKHIAALRKQCSRVAMVLLECVKMKWFYDSLYLMEKAKIKTLIDLGFHDQRQDSPAHVRRMYHFAWNGLTQSERETFQKAQTPFSDRPIPWAFVGHLTLERLNFAERLVERIDPSGFLYLVDFTPVTETGPHLNEQQFDRVLRRTRYKIWCSHHPFYYIESIRFRLALMAGTVPIKVNLPSQHRDTSQPFSYLIFTYDDFEEGLQRLDFEAARQRFNDDFAKMPSLESEMASLLARLG